MEVIYPNVSLITIAKDCNGYCEIKEKINNCQIDKITIRFYQFDIEIVVNKSSAQEEITNWARKNVLLNIQKAGIGNHQGDWWYLENPKWLRPFVCVKSTNGGGWTAIGKITGNVLLVPKGTAGRFIGKGGENIKKISPSQRLVVKEI